MNLNRKLRERERERNVPHNSSQRNTSLSVCMKAQKQSLDKKLIDRNTKNKTTLKQEKATAIYARPQKRYLYSDPRKCLDKH